MKKLIIPFLLCAASTLTCCKTSEQNYRQAYEAARQANNDGSDSITDARMRQEAVPSVIMADGDTVKMQREFVSILKDDSSPASLKKYAIVANQFKQLFNAKAMRNRLRAAGYTEAYVVYTSEPLYYVIATDFNDLNQAREAMAKLSDNATNLGIRQPFPWILNDPRRR